MQAVVDQISRSENATMFSEKSEKDEGNAFAKHLAMYHPEQIGNKYAFEFKLEEIHSKPLSRLCNTIINKS